MGHSLSAAALAALAACGGGGGGGGGGDNTAPANQAPTVTLATPAPGAAFAFGEPIRLTATAADSDGRVERVEFLDGSTPIGVDSTAPFELTWTGATAGAHTITARAIDDRGATAISASLSLVVGAAPPSPPPPPPPPAPPPPPPPPPAANQNPTVTITAPANNFKPNAPATFTLAANAADSDGSITKVEFFRVNPAAPVFDASTLLGPATGVGSPPSFQLQTTQPAGTYTFVARATDNRGATATSGSVQVIVNALPTVNLTAPAANATIQPGTTVTLRALASDSDGSVNKVDFFVNGGATHLGQGTRVGTTNEYTLPWSTTSQGTYSFTARATDNDGATQSTPSVAVNVPANDLPVVTLDDPSAGTNAPTILSLSASASDFHGVTSVQFLDNGGPLGNGTYDAATAKWRLQWPVEVAQFGTYVITARATDGLGAQATTASKSITIAQNVPPAVMLTSAAALTLPVNATSTSAFNLVATASDSDGIAKVEFFNGGLKLGEDTTAPYEYTWSGLAAGSYSVTARATDTVGRSTDTPAQTLVVTPNVEGPWTNLTTAQRAGLLLFPNGQPLVPNRPVEAGGVDAGEVLTIIGVTTVIPKFSAAMAQAALTLARAVPAAPTSGLVQGPCGSGRIQVFQSGANRIINLEDCVIGGFTYYGGGGMAPYIQYDTTTSTTAVPPATVPVHANPRCVLETAPMRRWSCAIGSSVDWIPTADGFGLVIQGVKVTNNGAPDPGGKDYPRNAFGYTTVTCTGAGPAMTCTTLQDVSFWWGRDLAWTDYSAGAMIDSAAGVFYATDDSYRLNGTHRSHYCSPDPALPFNGRDVCLANPPTARHIKFENMTPISGRAIVYGSNGWSVVTKIPRPTTDTNAANEYVQVRRTLTQAVTAGGVLYPATWPNSGPLETYRCAVGAASGDWSCAFVTSVP